MEDLLKDNDERFCLFPIKHDDIWKSYKTMLGCFWTAEEIDFKNDKEDYANLSKDEQYFIKMILAFFAGADGIVIDNLGSRFLSEVKWAELTLAYGFQLFMEGIHSETYSLLIDTYIKDDDDKSNLFNAINNFECIRRKQLWAKRWISDVKSSFAERLIAFACVEGIFFSSAFASIYWLKHQKKGLKGLTFSNELISRDEGQHTDLACLVYSKLKNRVNKKRVYEIVSECVEIEENFINKSLPCRLIGMNADLMSKYIKFVADRLLRQLGYNSLYKIKKCPFDFMELISLDQKTNFFESRVSSYAIDTNIKDDNCFNCEAEF